MNTIYKVGSNVVKFGANIAMSSTVETGTFDPSNVPFAKKEYYFADYTLNGSIKIDSLLVNAIVGSTVVVTIDVPNGSQSVIEFNQTIFNQVYGITSSIRPPAGKFVLIMTYKGNNEVFVEAPAFYGTSQMVTIPTSTAPTISSITGTTSNNGSVATINLTVNFNDNGSTITDSKIYFTTNGDTPQEIVGNLFGGTITQNGQVLTATLTNLPLNTNIKFLVRIDSSKGFDTKRQDILSAVSKPTFSTGLTTATKPPLSSTLRLESKLSSDGGSTVTQIGFIYGNNQTNVQNSTLGSLQGGVSSQPVPLNGNTTVSSINPIFILNNIAESSSLFVKAYAQNGAGVAYSTDNGQPITSYSTTINVPTITYTIPNNESGIAINTPIQLTVTANGETDVFYNTSGGVLNASTDNSIIASLFTLMQNGTSKAFTVTGKTKVSNVVTLTIQPSSSFNYSSNIFVSFGNVYDSLGRASSNNLSFTTNNQITVNSSVRSIGVSSSYIGYTPLLTNGLSIFYNINTGQALSSFAGTLDNDNVRVDIKFFNNKALISLGNFTSFATNTNAILIVDISTSVIDTTLQAPETGLYWGMCLNTFNNITKLYVSNILSRKIFSYTYNGTNWILDGSQIDLTSLVIAGNNFPIYMDSYVSGNTINKLYFSSDSNKIGVVDLQNSNALSLITLPTVINSYGIALDSIGRIYVANTNGYQIYRYNNDGTNETLIKAYLNTSVISSFTIDKSKSQLMIAVDNIIDYISVS